MYKILLFIFLVNLSLSQSIAFDNYSNPSDSLLNNTYLQSINRKHNTILGRDSDPKVSTDISKAQLWKERDKAIKKKYDKLNNEIIPKIARDK